MESIDFEKAKSVIKMLTQNMGLRQIDSGFSFSVFDPIDSERFSINIMVVGANQDYVGLQAKATKRVGQMQVAAAGSKVASGAKTMGTTKNIKKFDSYKIDELQKMQKDIMEFITKYKAIQFK